jgi:alpha-tubulin suppressor-like RCC1 family protein
LEGKKSNANFKSINRFPNSKKFDVIMESISTGPNHSAGVSVKKQAYSWGYSEGGRLGLSKEDAKKAKFEPTLVA